MQLEKKRSKLNILKPIKHELLEVKIYMFYQMIQEKNKLSEHKLASHVTKSTHIPSSNFIAKTLHLIFTT